MKKKTIQNRYIELFGILILVLALGRCAYDYRSLPKAAEEPLRLAAEPAARQWDDQPHRIYSVPSYKEAFPDSNATQLVAARKWGVKPVKNREDAEERKRELVYMDASPYYSVDELTRSIPYLVPRAAILLEDMGKAFFDSLQMKGLPLHRFVVTSVLRSQADVEKLRRSNKNATENSCHLYGTTFDISYTRFEVVDDPDSPGRQPLPDDKLKWVLSEVLRDMREGGRCYIKHEVKQPCFHITVR